MAVLAHRRCGAASILTAASRTCAPGSCASFTTVRSTTTPPGACAARATPRASTSTLDPDTEELAARGRPLDGLRGPGHRASWSEPRSRSSPSGALELINDWGLLELGEGPAPRRRDRAALCRAPELGRVRRPRDDDPRRRRARRAPRRACAPARPSSPSTRRRPRRPRSRCWPTTTCHSCSPWRGPPGRTGSTTTSTACATSSSRSTATTCSRRAPRRAPRSASA